MYCVMFMIMASILSSESSSGPQLNTKEISTIDKEKQQLMAEVDERKRRMLRDVEVWNYLI